MGLPFVTAMGPLSLHAWRMYECSFNETAKCEYQQGYWRFWYEADHRYAVPTAGFFTIAIILFSLGYIVDLLIPGSVLRTGVSRKLTATTRFLSYRAYRINALNWNSAPLGILALGAIGAIYFLCMTVVPQPYYWPNNEDGSWGGSPPIATRSGWLSLACLPFVFATAGKSNLVTALTGVSHEKLQVFHRWISYAFFVTALIHTFPFIVYNIQMGTMKEQWDTTIFYWTGVIALVAQAWLTFASMSPLRNMSYEFFKFTHFLAALIFVLFLFFHCDYTLSSWDYFIATGVLFSLSWLHRQIRIYFEHGIRHRATVSLAANGFIRVSVPTHARWQAGQHFFVRFLTLGLHAGSIHPFTACSLPEPVSELESTQSELVFYIRPRGGFTARLAHFAESNSGASVRVLLDGPYGGVDMRKIEQSQQQLVIAGGSGAGWVLPMISAFLRKQQRPSSAEKRVSGSMKVVLATRDTATAQWFERAVRDIAPDEAEVEIDIFYTGSRDDPSATKSNGQSLQTLDDPEKAIQVREHQQSIDGSSSASSRKETHVHHREGRPELSALIAEQAAAIADDQQLGVFVCGPLSMQNDAQNAVAAEQLNIMKGVKKQVYLHMEHFSWA